jgi:hypothetical protein
VKKIIALLIILIGLPCVAHAVTFADSVISYTLGTPSDDPYATYASVPQGIIGPPDWSDSYPYSLDPSIRYFQTYVNLGRNGEIIVQLERSITDGPGTDLIIHEIGASENSIAWVSSDLSSWMNLGLGTYSSGVVLDSTSWLYDFSGSITNSIRYVKIIDSSYVMGSDIDAVQGIYDLPDSSPPIVPEPGVTQVINFDDLARQDSGNAAWSIPEGYGGVNWTDWEYYTNFINPWNPHSPSVAVESFTNDNLMQWSTPVDFQGAWFAGSSYATVTFEGYLGGILQATSSTLIPSSTPTFLAANFGTEVDAVRVVSPVPAYAVMDDATFTRRVDVVPEPSSILLLSFGLLGTGLVRKIAKNSYF